MGGKSSKQTVGYKYYAGATLVLAKLVHKIKKIKIGDNDAWEGSIESEGTITINKPKLYGVNGTEGGFVGNIIFQPGLPTQMPNSYLLAKLGPDISASRGVSQIILPQPYLGNNPYIKDMEFLCERVHLLDDGSVQWYDEKAAIGVNGGLGYEAFDQRYKLEGPGSSADYSAVDYDDSLWPVGQGAFGNLVYGADAPTINTVVPYTEFSTLWIRNDFAASAGLATISVEVRHDNDATLWWNGELIPLTFVFGDALNTPKSIAEIPSNKVLGMNKVALRVVDTGANAICAGLKLTSNAIDYYDINPAHMLRECLTNPEWGYGYDAEDIDDVSFMAAADKLYDENFGIGYLWDDDTTELDALINKVTDIIDGNLYVDRETLKWTLTLVRNDYNPDDLIELRADYEVISISNYARPEFLELKNTIIVQYYNQDVTGNGSLTATNAALFLQQGVRIAETKDFELCGNSQLASVLAQRELAISSSPLSSCQVTANSTARNLKRGSVFKLTSPRHNYNQTIMRVTGLTVGDSTTKQIKLNVVEDRFAMPQNSFVTPQVPGSTDPSQSPQPVTNRLAIEVPYALLLGQDTQTNVDASLSAGPDIGYFGVAAARVTGAVNANIYADAGAGYEDLAVLDFCGYGELTADVDYLTDTLTLENFEDLDEVEAGSILQIDSELLSFTANATGVLTGLKRGILDTVPTRHLAGAKAFFIQDYLDGPERQYADGESVNIKLASNTPLGQLSLSAAAVDTVAFASRAIKPYPPGALKLNATAYPATITGALTVTWKHRNRLTQADTIVDTTQGDVTPEANTRYTLEFYDATDALIISRANIGPGTAAVVLNYTGNVTLKLWAVSDNGASTQKHSYTFAYTPPGGTTTSSITATDYTPVDNSTIINGGGD